MTTGLARAPTREYRTLVMNSRRWDRYVPRDSDIVIATYPKCGTTWTQRIVDLLVFQSPDVRPIMEISPWLDATFFTTLDETIATIDGQTHRRFVKSHLPFDALPIYDGVKYIHVVRDGRDSCWSFHNHQLGQKPEFLIGNFARFYPGRVVPPARRIPEDPHEYFLAWIAMAEMNPAQRPMPDISFFEFENTYWCERGRDNLLFVHYNDLKSDLAGEMQRISDFLGIATPQSLMPDLVKAAQFETMRAQGNALLPKIGGSFDHGAERFINKGTNGRWKDVLTKDDLARYDALVRKNFTPSQALWIEHGRHVAGDPRSLAD